MTRVLVVDDSGFMRLALRRIVEADGDLAVVGEAADGAAALEGAARLRPDVVTMDLEMPGIGGLAATRALAGLPDAPAIVVVSHHTRDGNDHALAALDAGAVDVVWKGSSLAGLDLGSLDRDLRGRLRHWARQRTAQRRSTAALPPAPGVSQPAPRPHPAAGAPDPPPPGSVGDAGGCDLIVVGASTGGPDALALLLAAAGPLGVPVVIAQHMPADLAPDLARHLGRRIGQDVLLGTDGMPLRPGSVIVIPGTGDGVVRWGPEGPMLRLVAGEGLVRPAVDPLFLSAALLSAAPLSAAGAGCRAVGVVLTGMGRDGAAGAAALRERGMPVLAQSPASCVVGGMPRSVINAGLATEVATPAEMGVRLREMAARAVRQGAA